ncbi:MAG TPA: YceI family protein [Streptosporangiaceae bacterium]|nr:YceI family protein [Streptosporangiaceae bacterium]
MDAADGNYRVGPESGRLLVKTARTGLGAKAGHDLTIEVTRWRGNVVIDTANPAGSSVTVEADVDSFEIREGTGGVKPLTDADRADIKNTIRGKLLKTARYPTITFASRRVSGTGESFRIDGDLTIMGATQPVTVEGRLADGHARGSAVVVQSRWGIRPYTAFLGALKLRDEVGVEFDVGLTAGA